MRSSLQIVDSTDNNDLDLITLDDLKVELGITSDDEDVANQIRLTRASRLLSEMCERRFAFAHAIETFTFEPGEVLSQWNRLPLSLYPIFEIESVVVGGSAIEETAFGFKSETGELWLNSVFWPAAPWPGTIVVEYSGGYDLPDGAPVRLQDAVVALVRDGRLAATESDTSAGALRQVTHGDLSVGYYAPSTSTGAASVLPVGVDDVVRFYKRATIA